jgi:hypothetical protein
MSEQLFISLQITLIGMLLVFGAIVLLWSVLGLLVRLTAGSDAGRQKEDAAAASAAETLLKKRAAVAAVAVAMALEETKDEPREFPLPPTAVVSAWQAVLRSNILNKRGNVR